MDLNEIKRMQAEKDFMMRNEGQSPYQLDKIKDPFGGMYGNDPNSDQVTPYPY